MMNFNRTARIGLVLIASAVSAAAQADTIAEWNFGTLATVAPDNTPAATNGTAATNSATAGTSVGMANTYAEASYPSGSAYTFDDITNDTNSTIGNGNVWRIRGSSTQSTQSGANGWSINAPEYSQGAQFSTTTANYDNIVLSFNWASTAQGIANMQVQYNTNVNNATASPLAGCCSCPSAPARSPHPAPRTARWRSSPNLPAGDTAMRRRPLVPACFSEERPHCPP